MAFARIRTFAAGVASLAVLVVQASRATVCNGDFDCTNGAFPVCVSGTCSAGASQCVGDDAADSGSGDDGPVDARALSPSLGSPASLTGAICGTPAYEADWYKVISTNGAGLSATLSWTGGDDLDLAAFDSSGRLQGYSLHETPENVSLTYLPAGTYYLRVLNSTRPAGTAATPYTIQASITPPQLCTGSADCAATYDTQLFRSVCSTGTCRIQAATAQALGAGCDADSDCASGLCSYVAFESGADRSVCTAACTTDTDCAAVGPGYHCTQGFAQNRCQPACANDLQCGADTSIPTVTPCRCNTATAAPA